jgi:predicted XRE-type DNA-binding protein
MSAAKKTKLLKVSKSPPPGWPTESEWKNIEKKLAKGLATKTLPENAGAVEKTKYELCKYFILYRRDQQITQREMAERIGVTESRVSEILHYHIDRFTIDKLLSLLSKIKPGIKMRVE